MSNKIKEFLFPNKTSNEMDTSTVMIDKNEIHQEVKSDRNNYSNVFTFTPKVFMQVEDVANELLSGKNVIVDLNDTDINEAKRICDFLNGVTFAINGKVSKIAKLIYLFEPK